VLSQHKDIERGSSLTVEDHVDDVGSVPDRRDGLPEHQTPVLVPHVHQMVGVWTGENFSHGRFVSTLDAPAQQTGVIETKD
jgi:hypothetical protein